MKKLLPIFITLSLIVLGLAGCRSRKEAVPAPPVPELVKVEEPTWKNVTLPVRVSMVKPQKFAFNGTATMVRGEYVYISIRMLGFEVGSVYLTPEEADLVVKQLMRIWVQEPVGDRLKKAGVNFTALQETLLGDRTLLKKLPAGVDLTFAGSETNPEVLLKTKLKGREVEVALSWDLDAAKWNRDNPATFRAPGGDIRKVSASDALKLIAGGK